MKDFENFKRECELREPAMNTKMIVVGVLVASVIVFTIMGKDNVKPIIWYWAAFMALLVIGCAVQDFMISRKIRR